MNEALGRRRPTAPDARPSRSNLLKKANKQNLRQDSKLSCRRRSGGSGGAGKG